MNVKSGSSPRQSAQIRPDRAADYGLWIQGKVQGSRDDPSLPIPDDEWQAIRAAKLASQKALTAS
jgi:hypothetical protein